MTLRDHFAATAPGMDAIDICDIMGWERDLDVGGPDDEGEDGSSWKDSIYSRWRELPLKTRLAAFARYAYMAADALLVERERPVDRP